MYHIAYAGWYPATGDQSPVNIIISEFVYTTSKEKMAAQIMFQVQSVSQSIGRLVSQSA